MDTPRVNILTRTSNRPKYFKNCVNSVNNQTYPNKRHIISVDDDESAEYVKTYTDDYVRVNENNIKQINNGNSAPYNLYLNRLNKEIKDGWVMYLDDDDKFIDDKSLSRIMSHIRHDDQLLLWKVKFPMTVIPEKPYFGKEPKITHISMIGFMYHSKYIDHVKFDGYKCADYRYISELYKIIDEKVWIDDIHTAIQRTTNMGGFGNRDDLKK